MSDGLLIFFAVVSAVTNFVGLFPYIRDILHKKTKPERATWWIWLSLSVVAFSAQVAAGATWSLAMTGAQGIAVLIIAFLSIKYGYGTFRKKDYLSLLIAGLGIVLWAITDNPLTALLIVIFVDILALYLTVSKTWNNPETETLISWVLATVSGLAGLLAVGAFDLTELVYPLYITLGNGFLSWVIFTRRKELSH